MKPITIACSGGTLAGILHLPSPLPSPAVICCHGLLSNKNGAKYGAVAEEMTKHGFATVRFDFSGCGESDARPEESLIASRLRDLHAVIDFTRRQHWFNGELSLLGSSFGGYVALLAASSLKHSLTGIACWATPFDLSRAKVALEELEALKSLYPPGFPLGEPRCLGPLDGVSRVLIVHGQQDEVIPWQDAVDIYRRVEDPKQLLLMERADHRFMDPEYRQSAIATIAAWLHRWISRD